MCRRRLCVPRPSGEGDDAGSTDTSVVCEAPLFRCGDTCVDRSRDAAHCGACDAPCEPGEYERATCISGTCNRACDPGHHDLEAAVAGCEYACRPTSPSTEICDGVDNDCDGDDDNDDSGLQTSVCADQDGVCRGAVRPCVDGQLRACADEDYALVAGDAYAPDDELACDGVDNDCDGAVDEHCCGAERPYVIVGDGGGWTVVDLRPSVEGPLLTAYDNQAGRIATWRLGRFENAFLVSETDANLCEDVDVVDIVRLPGAAEWLVACRLGETAAIFQLVDPETGAVSEAWSDQEVGIPGRIGVARIDDTSAAVVIHRHDDDDLRPIRAELSRLDLESGEMAIPMPLGSPEHPAIDAAVAADAGGALYVAYTTADPAAVWLQAFDADLQPVGDPSALVESAAISAGHRIAATRVGDATWFVHPGETNSGIGVTAVRPDVDPEPVPTELSSDGDGALRVQTFAGEGVLVSAGGDADLRFWALSSAGEIERSWVLDPFAPTRTLGDGRLPARWVAAPSAEILLVAAAVPGDVASEEPGLAVYRLGPDSHPLCR